MDMEFSELFEILDGGNIRATRPVRLGAVKIMPDAELVPGEVAAGFDIGLLVGKRFEVIEDGDMVTINRVYP